MRRASACCKMINTDIIFMVIKPLMKSRKINLFLITFAAVWVVILLLLTFRTAGPYNSAQYSDQLQAEILRLSEEYIQARLHETQHIEPVAPADIDLSRPLAAILSSLLDRVQALETRMSSTINVSSFRHRQMSDVVTAPLIAVPVVKASEPVKPLIPFRLPVNIQDNSNAENCIVPNGKLVMYPDCNRKIEWMRQFWQTDPCYAEFGVDGSQCSLHYYLSEVESWCPILPHRHQFLSQNHVVINQAEARLNFNMEELFEKLQETGHRRHYDWIKARIEHSWPEWVKAVKQFNETNSLLNRRQKQIVIYPGLLSTKSSFHIPELSTKGGPLGELVQWSDIIASLFILGHSLQITSEPHQLTSVIKKMQENRDGTSCRRSDVNIDLLYTDLVGLKHFKYTIGSETTFNRYRCRLRIIDSFGTEASFNHRSYARHHRMASVWSMHNLNLQQFYTMFPHSPDNSFMGFVVDLHNVSADVRSVQKKNQAVVYGKRESMWQGNEKYLDVVKKHCDIHGTVFTSDDNLSSTRRPGSTVLPNYVVNHGILSTDELRKLLQESKLFIGLGFPYEGPAALEAVAEGCIFINPQFNPPHSSANTKFFLGKPTLRQLTSQHPYMEDFIGEPNVYTVDIANLTAVDIIIRKALAAVDSGQVVGCMPFEFTYYGMLQRVNVYVEHQDFCSVHKKSWPETAIKYIVSADGASCKDTCWAQKRICEPSYFKVLNNETLVRKLVETNLPPSSRCNRVELKADIYHPSFDVRSKKCILQQDELLFSCVGGAHDTVRLCPCRDYIVGQTALCKDCT